jgi:hypothetical protein
MSKNDENLTNFVDYSLVPLVAWKKSYNPATMNMLREINTLAVRTLK